MGCFLACFGSSKHNRNRNASCKPQQQPSFPLVQDHSKILPNTSLQLQDKTVEELSVNARKKVTFDSNVKTYEPVLPEEVEKEEALVKPDHSKSSSEDSSVNSTGSYPPNHRYQNCRDSDDEDEEEELDDWPSDLSDDEDDGIREECDELGVEFEEDDMAYSKSRVKDDVVDHVFAEEVESPIIATCERDLKTIGFNPNARDRSVYVHPVLNPVENLSQWKIVKAKRTPRLRPQKENYASSDHELQVAFGVKEVSEPDMPKMLNQEIRVDASLSNWLGSSETTPIKKAGLYAVGGTPDRTTSQGSNSMISLEDRPILGALTVEEIKQFSATSSPRKSPCKSPDEMPIIGTVGSYWSSNEDSGSASSFKGIPNTTSKYREDKKVNWHATPFETRLEKALNRGAAEAYSTCVPHIF
ncbi:hypothetical protein P8452_02469 [Trifolium repens]|nr:hypothetical protein P8452_02469 [Trifolium repens]